MDKLLNFLGLCRRAGKLTAGNDMTVDSVLNGNARLVIVARDISRNTEKKLRRVCVDFQVPILTIDRTKEELSAAIGRFAAVTAVTDKGFAEKLTELINNETGGNSV